MARIDRILKAVEAEPWAIMPSKLSQLAEILSAKADAGQIPTASDIEAADARIRGEARKNVGGTVAVLPMFGTMSRRMGMMGAMSGGLSVETFSKAFAELVDDESVAAIVIDVDSPGGSVYGIEELSQQIFEAREKKRIIAVANQLMASAAFYVASAADEIVVSPSGEVGSIGVYSIHFDFSEAIEEEGVKVTIIKAGDRKAEGNPYESLSDETVEHMQSMVDAYYSQFIGAVARNRGITEAQVEANYGQGLTFDAARALERGMVDRIATLDEVLAELTGGTTVSNTPQAVVQTVEIAALNGLAIADEIVARYEGAPFDGVSEAIAEQLRHIGKAMMIDPDLLASEEVEEEIEPDVAAGHAAEDIPNAPTEPAPEAREEDMPDEVKGAQPDGAPTAAEVKQAERERSNAIRQRSTEFDIDAATVNAWLESDIGIDAVNAEILQIIKGRASEDTVVRVGEVRETKKPFTNLGDQLMSIIEAGNPGAVVDPRLMGIHAAASGSGSIVPSDGGFLLQPDFSSEILRRVYDLGEITTRVRRRPIGPNADGLKINAVHETSRATGSRYGGIQVYWREEGDTVTATKPKFRQMELTLRDLMGIWYVTDSLMKDSTALQAIGTDAFSEEMAFMVEDSVFRGTGAGQPKGFLNSNALVSVAKESAQTADTVNATNVLKMFSRLWPRSRTNAVWFINVDVEHQLNLMTLGDQPVYLPPGGLRDTPFGQLLGRPVIPVEYCETVGTVGDIVLADLDQYLMIDKGAAEQAWSMHVRFLNAEQTFRIMYRVDGQSTWTSALTPYKGTNTLSPFVVLASRD